MRKQLIDLDMVSVVGDGHAQQQQQYQHHSRLDSVKALAESITSPSPLRGQGCHPPHLVQVRAGPGTGKTWATQQMLIFIADQDDVGGDRYIPLLIKIQVCQCLASLLMCKILKHKSYQQLRLIPNLHFRQLFTNTSNPRPPPSQALAHLVRRKKLTMAELERIDFLRLYIDNTFGEDSGRHQMLVQALACRRLAVVLDGLDEAADISTQLEGG